MKSLGLIVDQRKGGAGACLGAGGVHRATCGWNLRFFNPCNGSTPEEDPCHFQPPLQQQTSGGRVWRGPNCFDVSRPAVPGVGAPHTWGAVQLGSHRSSSRPAIVSTQPSPPLPGTPQTRQIWQQNWTGRSKPCPNFGRLDQSMQITAPTAIA